MIRWECGDLTNQRADIVVELPGGVGVADEQCETQDEQLSFV